MLRICAAIEVDGDRGIGVRVGLHTGYVYGGVVTTRRPHYSFFGPTVSLAYRLCSHGVIGRSCLAFLLNLTPAWSIPAWSIPTPTWLTPTWPAPAWPAPFSRLATPAWPSPKQAVPSPPC